jgi:hypothetical protein
MNRMIFAILLLSYSIVYSQDVVISSQPKSIKECVGNSVSLSVSVYSSSNKPLSFQWYKEGRIISNENSPILKFSALQHSQSGTYYCQISNNENEKINTNSASIYALRPTSISKEPEDVMTSLVSDIITLSFEAHVSGLEIEEAIQNGEFVSIQWFRVIDNANIKLNNDEIYNGVISNTLSINRKNLPDTTYYLAEIEGKCGKAVTRKVKLIKNLSIIKLDIAGLEACEGNVESIKANIANPNNHKLEFQWYRDGKPIYYQENLKGVYSNELIFNPIFMNDAGQYKLEARIKEMNYSVFSNEVDVVLCSKPEIIAIRIDSSTSVSYFYRKALLNIFFKRNCESRMDVYKGDSLFISYSLQKSGIRFYNIPDPNYSFFSVLEFDKSDRFAKYSVEMHNRCGNSISDTITVNEHFNDYVNRDPLEQNRVLCEGDSTSIQFFFSFIPKRSYPLKYQWLTNFGTKVSDDRFYHGYETNKLLFKNLRKEDAGIFWFEARGNITNNPKYDSNLFAIGGGYLIKVKPKPSIKRQPKERTFSYGDKDTIINILFDNEPQLPISVELYYMFSLKNTPRLIDKTEAEYGMWYRYIKDITFSEDGYYYAVLHHNNDCKPVITDTVKVTVIPKGTTSVSTLESNSELLIQPNPASDFITISLPTLNKGLQPLVQNAQIFDVLGIEVISVETGLRPVSTKVDVSHLAAGVYFIKILYSNGASSIIEKFVKI